MSRTHRRAFGFAVTFMLAAHAGAAAQPTPSSPFDRTPTFGGANLFLAPHARTSVGALDVGGQLELDWGLSAARRGSGSIGFEPLDGLRLSASVAGGSASSDGSSGSDRVIGLALDAGRFGLAAAHRTAQMRFDGRTTKRQGKELRGWTALGRRVDLGVSLRTGTAAERGEQVEERTYVVAGYQFVSRNSTRYTFVAERRDVEADVTLKLGTVRVTGVAGRALADGITASRSWAYGRVALPMPRGLELLAEAGRTDGGTAAVPEPSRFARLGLRVDLGHAEPGEAPREPRAPVATSNTAASAVLDVAGSVPQLIITAPAAAGIEVKGDFTAWESRAMSRTADGRWSFAVRAGVLRFNIRIDGESWTVPAGVPVVADEFSGAPVAVVVVR